MIIIPGESYMVDVPYYRDGITFPIIIEADIIDIITILKVITPGYPEREVFRYSVTPIPGHGKSTSNLTYCTLELEAYQTKNFYSGKLNAYSEITLIDTRYTISQSRKFQLATSIGLVVNTIANL